MVHPGGAVPQPDNARRGEELLDARHPKAAPRAGSSAGSAFEPSVTARSVDHFRCERIYAQAIPGYDAMTEIGQSDAGQELRDRVRWRRRRPRKSHAGKPGAIS